MASQHISRYRTNEAEPLSDQMIKDIVCHAEPEPTPRKLAKALRLPTLESLPDAEITRGSAWAAQALKLATTLEKAGISSCIVSIAALCYYGAGRLWDVRVIHGGPRFTP